MCCRWPSMVQKPTMLGALALDAHLELPPGEPDVIDRLRLRGNLRIKDGVHRPRRGGSCEA